MSAPRADRRPRPHGRLVESLAPETACRDRRRRGHRQRRPAERRPTPTWRSISRPPRRSPATSRALAARGINLVIGTTGWQEHEARIGASVAARRIGVVVGAELRARRQPVRRARRARGRALRGRRNSARGSTNCITRAKKRRAVGHGDRHARRDAERRLHRADRRRVDARRVDSRHAHRWFRRPGRDDNADAHRPRSHRFARGALAAAKWVNGRQAGSRCVMFSGL